MVKNWSKERNEWNLNCELINPFSIASYWQGWERKERKPFNWPMPNHVNFVNKYPALLKWGLLIKKVRNSAICCSKLQLNVCVKRISWKQKRVHVSVSQSVMFVILTWDLVSEDVSNLLDGTEGLNEEVPTKSAGDFNQMETSPEGIRTLDLLNGLWRMGSRPTETCALMLKLQTSRSTF